MQGVKHRSAAAQCGRQREASGRITLSPMSLSVALLPGKIKVKLSLSFSNEDKVAATLGLCIRQLHQPSSADLRLP